MSNLIKKVKTQSGDAQIDYKALANLPTSDKTLTQEGSFADAKEVGDRLSSLSDEIANKGGSGITLAQVTLFEQLFNNLAYTDNVVGIATADSLIASLRAGASSGDAEKVPTTSIVLSARTLTFTDSDNQTLVATVLPTDTTDELVWASDNTEVAKVGNGVVTPIANGSCTITATSGSCSAGCSVTVNIAEEIVTYTINNTLANISTSNGATSINANSSYTARLNANDGYTLDEVIVTMGGTDITSEVYSNGVITIPSVTGNIVIIASGVVETPSYYTITNSLINVTTDNAVESVEANSSYTANLTPDSNYYIDTVTITMGGVNVTDTVYADGVITIPEVTGNVVIIANALESDNLIVLSECGTGGLPDGTSADGVEMIITPMIPVTPNTTYKTNITRYYNSSGGWSAKQKLAFYDAEQNYISVMQWMPNSPMGTINDVAIGDGVYYIQFVFRIEYTNPYFGLSGKVV